MTKQFRTSPPSSAARKSGPRYLEFQARDQFSGEMPETLCDVVNRICDRYLFRERDGWRPAWCHSSGRPT